MLPCTELELNTMKIIAAQNPADLWVLMHLWQTERLCRGNRFSLFCILSVKDKSLMLEHEWPTLLRVVLSDTLQDFLRWRTKDSTI